MLWTLSITLSRWYLKNLQRAVTFISSLSSLTQTHKVRNLKFEDGLGHTAVSSKAGIHTTDCSFQDQWHFSNFFKLTEFYLKFELNNQLIQCHLNMYTLLSHLVAG